MERLEDITLKLGDILTFKGGVQEVANLYSMGQKLKDTSFKVENLVKVERYARKQGNYQYYIYTSPDESLTSMAHENGEFYILQTIWERKNHQKIHQKNIEKLNTKQFHHNQRKLANKINEIIDLIKVDE